MKMLEADAFKCLKGVTVVAMKTLTAAGFFVYTADIRGREAQPQRPDKDPISVCYMSKERQVRY